MREIFKHFFSGLFKSIWILAAAILGLIYIVSPLDLIPDVIPILGWLDDLGALGFVIKMLVMAFYKRIALWVLVIPVGSFFALFYISKNLLPLPVWLPLAVSIPLMVYGFWKIGRELEDD